MWRSSLLFCLLWSAMHLPVQAEAPNIVFITVDTTRADRMGFLGNAHGLTPNLDLVARQGVVFERAFSQAPLTPVSHATIFTGTYPQFHTVTDFGHPLPALLPSVPEILQKSGYHTVERRAGDVVAHTIAWLDKNRQVPFFAWVHLYDPHAPYDPPPPYDNR